jgi:uncharacterized protein (DUF3084 family)
MKLIKLLSVIVLLFAVTACETEKQKNLSISPVVALENQLISLKQKLADLRKAVANEDLKVKAKTKEEKKQLEKKRRVLYQANKSLLKSEVDQLKVRVFDIKKNAEKKADKETIQSTNLLLDRVHALQNEFKPIYED